MFSAGARRFLAVGVVAVICGALICVTAGCGSAAAPQPAAAAQEASASPAGSGAAPSATTQATGTSPTRTGTRPTTRTPTGPSPTGSSPTGSSPTRAPATPTRPSVPSSPLLYPWKDGTLRPDVGPPADVELASAGGNTRDGDPYRPAVFEATNVWLTPSSGVSAFDLTVDAGREIGTAVQTRLSYDLTGDGEWDRVETYRYFALDPLAGLEHYTEAVGLLSSEGKLGEMRGGVIRAEVWSALGEGISLSLQDSSFSLPFDA